MVGKPASHLGWFSGATSWAQIRKGAWNHFPGSHASLSLKHLSGFSPTVQACRGPSTGQAEEVPGPTVALTDSALVALRLGECQMATGSAVTWFTTEPRRPIWGCLSQPEHS